MQNANKAFNVELERLLKEYLGEDSLDMFCNQKKPATKIQDQISEKINDVYREQLKININNYSERILVDRTITFSEKNLHRQKFGQFLLRLGHLCLSDGKLTLAVEIFRKVNTISTEAAMSAEALLGLADVYSKRASWARSFSLISEAETLYSEVNDSLGLAKCKNLLGSIYGEMGNVDGAGEQFNNGLSLIDSEKNLDISAKLETNMGIVDNIKGNNSESIRHLNKAINIYRQLGSRKNEAEVNLNIGMVYLDSGMPETAISIFDEGITMAKEGRFMSVLCLYYLAKSQALISLGTLHYATEFADKALELSHYLDDKLTLADLYKVKGILERKLKNYSRAENYLLDSLRINTSFKNEMNIAETSVELALLYKEMDNTKSKQSYLKSSLNYFRQISASEKVKKIEELIGTEAA